MRKCNVAAYMSCICKHLSGEMIQVFHGIRSHTHTHAQTHSHTLSRVHAHTRTRTCREQAWWTGPVFAVLDIALIVACQPGSFVMELAAGYSTITKFSFRLLAIVGATERLSCIYAHGFFPSGCTHSSLYADISSSFFPSSSSSVYGVWIGIPLVLVAKIVGAGICFLSFNRDRKSVG